MESAPQSEKYHPESYWGEVAREIASREEGNLIAGDDEPYYVYKRKKYLQVLDQSVSFTNKKVLEIGSGPGGNLREVYQRGASEVTGVDITQGMVEMAQRNLSDTPVRVIKIDGQHLPFDDKTFDIVFTSTVLQHNTDDAMMRTILQEACRVAGKELLLCEKLDTTVNGTDLCMARPVSYYAGIVQAHGFHLASVHHINNRVSYYVCGAFRKLLNPRTRKEGEPITGFCRFMQQCTLPLTKPLDRIFTSKKDVGCMLFVRSH